MAASAESQVLVEIYADIKKRLIENPAMSLEAQRDMLEVLHAPASEPTDVTYDEVRCPGTVRPAIWCKPISASASKVILYIHGGGGFAGSPSSHRKLAAHLAKAAGSYALVIDYRLAPEHPFPAGLDDVIAAYDWLIEEGFAPGHIALAGDSAGGNLVTATGLKLKKLRRPLPAAIVAFSPWVDMESLGESRVFNADKDVLNPPGIGDITSQLYRGEKISAKDPLANPLYADFTGMPPMYISSGGWEILVSDSTTLAERAKAAGVEIILEVASEMQHVYHFLAGNAPEANKSIHEVGNWLREKIDR